MNRKDKALIYHQRIVGKIRIHYVSVTFRIYLSSLAKSILTNVSEDAWTLCPGYHNLTTQSLEKFSKGQFAKNFIFSRQRKENL